jgi:hypothetical protein
MSRVLTLVSGAKKNVGDFLIFQKAKENEPGIDSSQWC